jgi:hypothetical protein
LVQANFNQVQRLDDDVIPKEAWSCFSDQFLVTAYAGSSKNLKDLKDPETSIFLSDTSFTKF